MLDYPYFVDVRGDGKNDDSPITADVPQVTLPWVSPIDVDATKNTSRTVVELLKSSPDSWRSDVDGRHAENRCERALGVYAGGRSGGVGVGRRGRGSVQLVLRRQGQSVARRTSRQQIPRPRRRSLTSRRRGMRASSPGSIDKSPESARLFVFGSNTFLSDQTLSMIGSAAGTVYGNSLQLVANAVDWSLEDRGLLAIRSRGHFNRTLPPLPEAERMTLEYSNYGIALAVARSDLRRCTGRARKRVLRSTSAGSALPTDGDDANRRSRMNRHVKALTLLLAFAVARARRHPRVATARRRNGHRQPAAGRSRQGRRHRDRRRQRRNG